MFSPTLSQSLQLIEVTLKVANKQVGVGPSRFNYSSVQGVLERLYILNGILSSLKTHLEINEADESRRQTLNILAEPLNRCRDALELVKDRLENATFLGSHVLGKAFDKKFDRALSVLDESQRLIQTCLLSDQQTITSAVE